jgi:hypothetical protein
MHIAPVFTGISTWPKKTKPAVSGRHRSNAKRASRGFYMIGFLLLDGLNRFKIDQQKDTH